MKVRIDGFHGTDMKRVESIQSNGFKPSVRKSEWLGDGVYFFVKGLNEKPEDQAEQWAVVSSWDKHKKEYTYEEYAVLHGVIEVDESKYLDLTEAEGVKILDYLQEKYTDKLAMIGKKLQPIDGYLINFARGEHILDIEVVKGNVYIKLKKEDRIHKLSRRTSNCTICSVYAPKNNIIECNVFKTGGIGHEVR